MAYHWVEQIGMQLLEPFGIVNVAADTVGGLVPLQPVYPVGVRIKRSTDVSPCSLCSSPAVVMSTPGETAADISGARRNIARFRPRLAAQGQINDVTFHPLRAINVVVQRGAAGNRREACDDPGIEGKGLHQWREIEQLIDIQFHSLFHLSAAASLAFDDSKFPGPEAQRLADVYCLPAQQRGTQGLADNIHRLAGVIEQEVDIISGAVTHLFNH